LIIKIFFFTFFIIHTHTHTHTHTQHAHEHERRSYTFACVHASKLTGGMMSARTRTEKAKPSFDTVIGLF
jgi:hypothetical protein